MATELFKTGQILANVFEVGEPLTEGGFGAVYDGVRLDDDVDRIIAQVTTDPEPPSAEQQATPVWPVLEKLMKREPDERCASAAVALTELRARAMVTV